MTTFEQQQVDAFHKLEQRVATLEEAMNRALDMLSTSTARQLGIADVLAGRVEASDFERAVTRHQAAIDQRLAPYDDHDLEDK